MSVVMDTETNLDRNFLIRFLEHGGKWQRRQIITLYIGTMSTVCQSLMIAFIGFQPKYVCTDNYGWDNFTGGVNSTDVFDDKCEVFNYTTNSSTDCGGGFQYDVGKHESIVSEWDLVCGKAYMSEISQVLLMIGMAVGSFMISPLSDRIGRKWPYLSLRFVFILASFGTSLSPNIIVFMICRFFIGLLTILSSVKRRSDVPIINGLIWTVGLCILALVAHLLRGIHWRYLQAVLSITTLWAVCEAFIIKESLLWLLVKNRKQEVNNILHMAMKLNGVTAEFFKDKEINEMIETAAVGDMLEATTVTNIEEEIDVGCKETKGIQKFRCQALSNQSTLIQLIKSKTTRPVVFILCFAWFVVGLVYYGIFLMSSAMAGDRILNFFLSTVAEFPSVLALYVSARLLGRKSSLIGLYSTCAVAMMLAGIFPLTLSGRVRDLSMQIVMFVGKFGISASFSLVYFYTGEVFPTNLRASGLGMGSTSARFGSFLSPFSGVLARELPWGPGFIFGGLCFVMTLALFLLPETRGRYLPQTVKEIEEWDRRKEIKSTEA